MEAEAREIVKKVIEELAKTDQRGARFDKVINALEKQGLKRNQIDDAVLDLLDNDRVTEDQIGWLKPKRGLLDW